MSGRAEPVAPQGTADAGSRPALPPGVPLLTSLYLYVAGSCNLACRHCWIAPSFIPGGNGGSFLKLEHIHKAVREAAPLGLRSVKLTGGEPTLHPQFCDIVSVLGEAGLATMIETNGTLVDRALASFLRAHPTVTFISVSVDGADAETHDGLRAVAGSFDSALAGIRALVEVGFHPQLICTLHRGNVGQVEKVAALAEALGCSSVKFNLLQRVGRGQRLAADEGLAIEEVLQLNRTIESELVSRFRLRIHLDLPMAFRPIRRLLDDGLGVCAIRNVLGLLAGGELSLCGIGTSVPELIFGHIRTDNLAEVWCTRPALARLREEVPARLEGICGQCLHRDLCLGACVADNYHSSGRLGAAHGFCQQAEELGLFPPTRKLRRTVETRRSS